MTYGERLGNFAFQSWVAFAWLLFALPALYFFHTTIHEGTHATTALFASGNFPKLVPFPHLTNSGSFLNGVTLTDPATVVTVTERDTCSGPARPNTRLAGFIAMPQFVALFEILVFSLIFAFAQLENPFVRVGLRTWFLGACVDFFYGSIRGLIGGCNPDADWSKFMLRADIHPAAFAVMTWLFWLAVLSVLLWVNWWKVGATAARSAGFWDYRWWAFILALLSTLCIILSVAISDPRVEKDNAAFAVLLAIQIAAAIWYWLYFGLSFKLANDGAS